MAKGKKKTMSPLTFCLTTACILLAAFVLYGNITLNELTLETSRRKSELADISSRNDVLNVSIERKNSIANIEEIATEKLGMIKLESYNIHTVNLAKGDVAEIVPEKQDNSFLDGVVHSFNILYEYLN